MGCFGGLGWMMDRMGALPIYRAMDQNDQEPEAVRQANPQSLRSLAEGRYSCLFPEGESHDSPYLLELKTAAARFYYQARQLQEAGHHNPVLRLRGVEVTTQAEPCSHSGAVGGGEVCLRSRRRPLLAAALTIGLLERNQSLQQRQVE